MSNALKKKLGGEIALQALVNPESASKVRLRAIMNIIEHENIGGKIDGKNSYIRILEDDDRHFEAHFKFTIPCTPHEVENWRKAIKEQ
jgi:hypothetical protein